MPHQIEGIDWMRPIERTLLADEAGLGKSAQLLRVAKEPVLVVAPAMVLNAGTWDDEIELWTPGIDATQVAYSSIAQRGVRGRVPRDSNGFPKTPLKPEYRRHWGTVVLDESHYIKGRKTSWANAVLDIDADETRLATGTPVPNWAHEAFMPLRALYPDEARAGKEFGSYWRWAKKWFHVGDGRFGNREIGDLRTAEHIAMCIDEECRNRPPVTWEDFRFWNWGEVMKRRLREDVLKDLPPLTVQEWRTPMVTAQAKAYRELRRDYITELESGEVIDVWTDPGKLVKLAQIATGLEVVGGKGSGKLNALESMLEDRPSNKLVVAHFQASVNACADVARRVGRTVGVVHGNISMARRKEVIRGFQSGDISILCASIGTISEGLTLHQGGADEVVRVERAWSPYKNEQVMRRLHRIGVTRPVLVTDLITPNSMDERVLALLEQKSEQQMHALTPSEVAAII